MRLLTGLGPASWCRARTLARGQDSSTVQVRRVTVDCVARRLGYFEYGDPGKVVSLQEERLQTELGPGQVLTKYLLCPVNPADINTLQGSYPIRPALPAVGGGEGVAEVVTAGPDCSLKPGDWVLPGKPMSGTWVSHSVSRQEDWIPVRNDIPAMGAATMMVNPCTALRMLLDFVHLKPGDWVVQNGSNSAVGRAVIQIAHSMGLKTVNLVRDREEIQQLKQTLTELGADIVLTEEEGKGAGPWRSGSLPRPRLAFNCVGGASSTTLLRALENGATMVTYGGMSRQPVTAATSHLIFKDLRLAGFWMGQWNERQGRSEARLDMVNTVADLIHRGDLSPPATQVVALARYREALDNTLRGFLPAKYVFDMQRP